MLEILAKLKKGRDMSAISEDLIINQLQWRYATKLFDPSKKVSESDWNFLKQVIQLAPSSYGLQPWKAVVVQNQQKRIDLRAASYNQSQIQDCSHLVVFTTLKNITEQYVKTYVAKIAEVRSIKTEQLIDYQNMMIGDLVNGPRSQIAQAWAQRQAYIALGFLLQAAALRGIDACPMEGFDPSKYDEILEINKGEYASVAVAALGYRASNDSYQTLKKVRLDMKDLVQVV